VEEGVFELARRGGGFLQEPPEIRLFPVFLQRR
jgi:hypothetical protein